MRKSSSQPKERPLDEDAAREKCLRLLAVRARSSFELRQRLLQAGFDSSVTATVLENLAEAGLLDDSEFAQSWAAGRRSAGIGPHRLRAELARKGLPRETVEQALAATADAEAEHATVASLARKRLQAGAEDPQTVARVRRFLLGRGYSFEVIDDVLRELAGDVAL